MTNDKFSSEQLDFKEVIDRKLFSDIQTASKNGDSKEVIKLLNELIKRNKDCAMLYSFLANAYWNCGEIENALQNFKKATKLDPVNEKISVGLFHLLLNIDREDEAFSEIKRFVSGGGVMSRYKEILEEINKNN